MARREILSSFLGFARRSPGPGRELREGFFCRVEKICRVRNVRPPRGCTPRRFYWDADIQLLSFRNRVQAQQNGGPPGRQADGQLARLAVPRARGLTRPGVYDLCRDVAVPQPGRREYGFGALVVAAPDEYVTRELVAPRCRHLKRLRHPAVPPPRQAERPVRHGVGQPRP